ncbi:MAG: hypothetical protein DRH90_18765 [Deltaproteobacteria bacterium]|nr:MAG: hypothetical protein DRH90_18765 [Deltaproteobacteria bacterium]RLC15774.1 MAG: hypothetical protein DRI24_10075 [Deltaproteobacteria bacterium]
MLQDDMIKKLNIEDIGYYGKQLDTLNRVDLIGLCLQLSQTIYECSHKEHTIKDRSYSEE